MQLDTQAWVRASIVKALNAHTEQVSCAKLNFSSFFPSVFTSSVLQGYYQNRPAMATSAPRVQTSSGTRPVGPAHVYPPGSQMMMISQQQLSFAGSPQGYFIPPPGQVDLRL